MENRARLMTTPKRYDTLRLQLIRLYQAMEKHSDLAGEMFRDSTGPASQARQQDPSTFRVLPSIEGSRQHARIKDRLPLIYSESPEIAEQVALDASRTKTTVEFEIPEGVATGTPTPSYDVSVTVDGRQSNTLPFRLITQNP